jgi:hypothetical protein
VGEGNIEARVTRPTNKKKVGGVLRHPVLTLKKVARFLVKIERRS